MKHFLVFICPVIVLFLSFTSMAFATPLCINITIPDLMSSIGSWLDEGTDFISHLTLGSGADNLMGQMKYDTIPEPTTMLLFSFGLLGIAGVSRRVL